MKNNLKNIFKKEIREMFRDKKSLSMMLIIPFMIPLLVLGMSALFEMQLNKPIEQYNKIGFAYELSEVEQNILKEMNIDYQIKTLEELEESYKRNEINLYVKKINNTYELHGNDKESTTFAKNLIDSYFNVYKEYLQQEYLDKNNINPTDILQIINVENKIVEEETYFANYITNYAFLFIVMAITVSATYPATDSTAGEKERGTLETLLTFPIRSKDIILGKFLSVSLSSIITGFISLILTIISLILAGKMFKIYEGIDLMLPPTSLLFASIVILCYSFLISGLCISIASRQKSFKEAQSALTPLTFISFFPGMIAFMINLETTPVLSCVPFLNFTLLFTDITNNNANILNIILMLISTFIVITLVLTIIIKQYKSENVLFKN